MTEKEQEILDLYLKDLQKKRLIITFIIISVIIIGGASAKKYLTQTNEDIVSNENITQENVMNNVSNNIKEENTTEKTEDKKEETKEETTKKEENAEVQKTEVKEETKKQESNSSNKQPETKTEQVSSKPANRDFLFTDGYTMENVTQAAQDYLSSSGHAGECTPIKDNEGIYLGMRVTFY